jgi:DNA repair exonuclease SbcCD ATPase subunit
MKEKFEDVLRRELKKEFEHQMNVQLNQHELGKVIKEYKKIKKFQKTPWYDVMQMDKKSKQDQ